MVGPKPFRNEYGIHHRLDTVVCKFAKSDGYEFADVSILFVIQRR